MRGETTLLTLSKTHHKHLITHSWSRAVIHVRGPNQDKFACLSIDLAQVLLPDPDQISTGSLTVDSYFVKKFYDFVVIEL